jgi:iron uptake system component EfeO
VRIAFIAHRLGMALAVCLAAAVSLALCPQAHASGDLAKPATYAPDEALLTVLDGKAAAYKDNVAAPEIQNLVAGVDRLAAATQQGDIAGARQAWIDVRVVWARSETFTADLFPDLERKINEWPDAPSGFHAIEAKLFAAPPQLALEQTQALVENVHTYQRVFAQSKFTGYYLIAGASTLAYEMGETVKEGGESPVSGTSLGDLQHNIEGIENVWRLVFADEVRAKKHFLAEQIDDQITAIKAILAVPSLDQIPPEVFHKEAEKLASALATASVTLGWRAPDYTDIGE